MSGSIDKPTGGGLVGFEDHGGAAGARELLASLVGVQTVGITLSKDSIDTGNDTTTDLRMGLLLSQDSTTGLYREFNNGEESSAVVLNVPIFGVDKGNRLVGAYWAGAFKTNSIKIPTGTTPDFDKMQRLSRRPTDQ